MKFALISTATGKISQTLTAPSAGSINVPYGMSLQAAPTQVEDHTHYWHNNSFATFPPSPSPIHTWSWVTKQWVDSRTLDQLKAAKWVGIKSVREAVIDAPLVTVYGTLDCKAKDRTNITDAVLMLQTLASIGSPTTIDFTLADNSTVTLATVDMVTIGLMLGQKVQAAHSQARILRAQIDAASSAAELELISWTY